MRERGGTGRTGGVAPDRHSGERAIHGTEERGPVPEIGIMNEAGRKRRGANKSQGAAFLNVFFFFNIKKKKCLYGRGEVISTSF